MLRRLSICTLLLCCVSAHAQDERECLGSAKMAEIVATLMETGQSEKYVIALATDPKGADPKRPKIRQKVIDDNNIDIVRWVYTMRPNPSDARATMYAKCKAGELGFIDWSKHREAARAR
jgi:hypothetical protein